MATKQTTARRPVRAEAQMTRHNLLVRVARLYYLCRMTHQEIATREGVSRIRITRLLKEAVDKKIVEFSIKDPVLHNLELEDSLQSRFALKTVIITPAPTAQCSIFEILGRFAADFLTRRLVSGLSIGIGWGRTMNGMLPYLDRTSAKGVRVISLTGGLAAHERLPNPYDVASAVAARLGAIPHYPIVPAIVESVQAKEFLVNESNVRDIMKLWARIDIALMSIGILSPEAGVYYSFPDPVKEAERVRALGGVGDLLAMPYDFEGRFLQAEFRNRMIVIDLEALKRIPVVAGIAGGKQKVQAILGALRTGCLNALITDEDTAKRVIRADKEERKVRTAGKTPGH